VLPDALPVFSSRAFSIWAAASELLPVLMASSLLLDRPA
jgi:hypothetical protein